MSNSLLSTREAAEKLGMSLKTLRGHVQDGAIRYIVTGRGKKRPGIAFDPADLEAFTEQRRRTKVVTPCPSTNTKPRPSGNSTLNSTVTAFTAVPRPGRNEKLRP